MPNGPHQLGSIINQISGARAELKALEQQARDTAAEAAATQRHLRDIQAALVEHFMRLGDLHRRENPAGQVRPDADGKDNGSDAKAPA
jgi:hypothetical protein